MQEIWVRNARVLEKLCNEANKDLENVVGLVTFKDGKCNLLTTNEILSPEAFAEHLRRIADTLVNRKKITLDAKP